jgi:hypothetical protein
MPLVRDLPRKPKGLSWRCWLGFHTYGQPCKRNALDGYIDYFYVCSRCGAEEVGLW